MAIDRYPARDLDAFAVARDVADAAQHGRPLPEVSDEIQGQWHSILGTRYGSTAGKSVAWLASTVAHDQRVRESQYRQTTRMLP